MCFNGLNINCLFLFGVEWRTFIDFTIKIGIFRLVLQYLKKKNMFIYTY